MLTNANIMIHSSYDNLSLITPVLGSTTTNTNPQSSSVKFLSKTSTLISTGVSNLIASDTNPDGSNEARAAPAIQIALDSYCKVRKLNFCLRKKSN